MSGTGPDASRRRLAEAADALAEFNRLAGVVPAPEAPSAAWREPAEAAVRAALDEARDRMRELESELTATRLSVEAATEENRALIEAVERGRSDAADAEALRVRANEAEARAASLKERMTLLEAECVRLDSLRRKAERATADAEAAGRSVDESLRRELRKANAALDRAAAEAGAQDARAKSEIDTLRARLESATARLQSLEREKRLELARGSGDAAALQTELQRALAVGSALRAELAAARAAAEQQEEELRRELTAVKGAFEETRVALEERTSQFEVSSDAAKQARDRLAEFDPAALEALQDERQRALAVAAALRADLLETRAAAERQDEEAQQKLSTARREFEESRAAADRQGEELRRNLANARRETEGVRAELQDRTTQLERAVEAEKRAVEAEKRAAEAEKRAREALSVVRAVAPTAAAASSPAVPVPPVPAAPEDWAFAAVDDQAAPAVRPDFISPAVEPVLDPGWSRLLRLVRPPVESAYSHLRRLSATAMTAGQQTILRLAAASIAQASDSLSSIELALEEGPAVGAPAPAMPLLEESLAAWESAFRRRGLALAREFPAALPPAVHDPKELRVVFAHALRNVLEALPRGGRLGVRAWRGKDGGLVVEFADDGPGFPPEWLARRFEPFAAPRRGRAGLGLSLVRRTLRRWGGDAEASNGPAGRGARLTLMFAPPPPPAAPAK